MPRIKKPSFNLIIILVPLIMITAGTFLLFKIVEKKRIIDTRDIFTSIEIILPDGKTDSISISFQNSPFLIIYFEPDCHYCHSETEALLERIDELAGINIYLVSTDEWEGIKKFSNQYNLENYHRISAGKVSKQSFFKAYGASVVPSLFIYDETGKLLYNSSGYTPVTDILQALNR